MTERLSLRSAYLYLVCLVTLVMALVGGVQTVRSAVDLGYPGAGYYGVEPAIGPDGKPVDEAERRRREQAAEEAQRRDAALGLVGSAALLLLAGPTYLYHWRRVQAEHSAARPAEAALPG